MSHHWSQIKHHRSTIVIDSLSPCTATQWPSCGGDCWIQQTSDKPLQVSSNVVYFYVFLVLNGFDIMSFVFYSTKMFKLLLLNHYVHDSCYEAIIHLCLLQSPESRLCHVQAKPRAALENIRPTWPMSLSTHALSAPHPIKDLQATPIRPMGISFGYTWDILYGIS